MSPWALEDFDSFVDLPGSFWWLWHFWERTDQIFCRMSPKIGLSEDFLWVVSWLLKGNMTALSRDFLESAEYRQTLSMQVRAGFPLCLSRVRFKWATREKCTYVQLGRLRAFGPVNRRTHFVRNASLHRSQPPHPPYIYENVRNLQKNKVGEAVISVNDKIVTVHSIFAANKNRCPDSNLEPSNA